MLLADITGNVDVSPSGHVGPTTEVHPPASANLGFSRRVVQSSPSAMSVARATFSRLLTYSVSAAICAVVSRPFSRMYTVPPLPLKLPSAAVSSMR